MTGKIRHRGGPRGQGTPGLGSWRRSWWLQHHDLPVRSSVDETECGRRPAVLRQCSAIEIKATDNHISRMNLFKTKGGLTSFDVAVDIVRVGVDIELPLLAIKLTLKENNFLDKCIFEIFYMLNEFLPTQNKQDFQGLSFLYIHYCVVIRSLQILSRVYTYN